MKPHTKVYDNTKDDASIFKIMKTPVEAISFRFSGQNQEKILLENGDNRKKIKSNMKGRYININLMRKIK